MPSLPLVGAGPGGPGGQAPFSGGIIVNAIGIQVNGIFPVVR